MCTVKAMNGYLARRWWKEGFVSQTGDSLWFLYATKCQGENIRMEAVLLPKSDSPQMART